MTAHANLNSTDPKITISANRQTAVVGASYIWEIVAKTFGGQVFKITGMNNRENVGQFAASVRATGGQRCCHDAMLANLGFCCLAGGCVGCYVFHVFSFLVLHVI